MMLFPAVDCFHSQSHISCDRFNAFTRVLRCCLCVCACSDNCRVTNCVRITDTLLLPSSRVEGSVMERCTVLSSATDPSIVEGGSVVRDALLQWGTHVDTMACVDTALICEHGHVDRHGKLLGSLLGPMSGTVVLVFLVDYCPCHVVFALATMPHAARIGIMCKRSNSTALGRKLKNSIGTTSLHCSIRIVQICSNSIERVHVVVHAGMCIQRN
jgi:hypothetical protein